MSASIPDSFHYILTIDVLASHARFPHMQRISRVHLRCSYAPARQGRRSASLPVVVMDVMRVTEAPNATFSRGRLPIAEPAHLTAVISEAMHDFTGPMPRTDDITLVCLRVAED
jgi:hypothetical protein